MSLSTNNFINASHSQEYSNILLLRIKDAAKFFRATLTGQFQERTTHFERSNPHGYIHRQPRYGLSAMSSFASIKSFRLNNPIQDRDLSSLFLQPSLSSTMATKPPPHSSHPDFLHLILLVFEAVLEVVCVSLPGYIVARQGMFNAEMQKFAANLNVMLFTPCLSEYLVWSKMVISLTDKYTVFNKLASQLSADKLADLAIIPFIFAIQMLVSWLSAIVISWAFAFKKRPRNFVIAMGVSQPTVEATTQDSYKLTFVSQVFGNSNSLPISLVLSLSHTISGLHWDKVPGDNDNEVGARGILYLLIFQQLGQLVRWSWGYNVLLAPPEQITGEDENTRSRLEQGQFGEANNTENQPLLDDASVHSDDDIQRASTDDERQAGEIPKSSKGNAIGSDSDQGYASGTQSPVTHQPYASSGSSTLSSPVILPPAEHNLATPSNGNIKPSNGHSHKMVFTNTRFSTSSNDEDIPQGIRGVPFRIKAAVKHALSVVSDFVSTISHYISSACRSAFTSLPRPIQSGLATMGHGLGKFFGGVWEFMNPPLWAMLAAIIVASVPPLQRLFFTPGTFIENSVTSAIRQSGGVAVPLILVVLGANLARNTLPVDPNHTWEDDKEETRILIASLISRMLLPTIIMAPVLALAAKYVPVSILDDSIFIIVCFLLTGAPSALQLAQICQLNNVYVGAMGRLLFQSYVIWLGSTKKHIRVEFTKLSIGSYRLRSSWLCVRLKLWNGHRMCTNWRINDLDGISDGAVGHLYILSMNTPKCFQSCR